MPRKRKLTKRRRRPFPGEADVGEVVEDEGEERKALGNLRLTLLLLRLFQNLTKPPPKRVQVVGTWMPKFARDQLSSKHQNADSFSVMMIPTCPHPQRRLFRLP